MNRTVKTCLLAYGISATAALALGVNPYLVALPIWLPIGALAVASIIAFIVLDCIVGLAVVMGLLEFIQQAQKEGGVQWTSTR